MVEVKKSWLDKLLAKAGFAKAEEATFGMELSTAAGGSIEIEREEGEPQVGDAASPDGEHAMPDGTTIVIAEGVITEIRPAGEEGEGEEEAEDAENVDEEKADERDEKIAALESEVETLKGQLKDAEERAVKAEANAKSKDELAILNAVKMAGGREWLAKNCSTYKVSGRKVSGVKAKEVAEEVAESDMRKRINELKNKK
jgi:ATP-dependent Clp protease protease subunit